MSTPTPTATPVFDAGQDALVLGYHLTRETWHYPFTQRPDDTNVAMVGLYGPGGGCAWEFAIDEEPCVGGLRVKVFDDAWAAFSAISEVFIALGDRLGRGADLGEVVEILDEFGFVDLTRREPDDNARAAIANATAAFNAIGKDAAPEGETTGDADGAPPGGVPEECEPWGCDGSGWSHQGTSYKSGEPEAQYAPCGRRCGRAPETAQPVADQTRSVDTMDTSG